METPVSTILYNTKIYPLTCEPAVIFDSYRPGSLGLYVPNKFYVLYSEGNGPTLAGNEEIFWNSYNHFMIGFTVVPGTREFDGDEDLVYVMENKSSFTSSAIKGSIMPIRQDEVGNIPGKIVSVFSSNSLYECNHYMSKIVPKLKLDSEEFIQEHCCDMDQNELMFLNTKLDKDTVNTSPSHTEDTGITIKTLDNTICLECVDYDMEQCKCSKNMNVPTTECFESDVTNDKEPNNI